MKKFTILMLALTIVFVMTACGKTADTTAPEASAAPAKTTAPAEATAAPADAAIDKIKPEDGAKLIVWDATDQRPYIESIAKQFTEKYNVEVTFEELHPRINPENSQQTVLLE
jgi:arabinogalactan oligomer/maltooligosaccharide transport system substrate-binding protein